jgi:hypothetical protein
MIIHNFKDSFRSTELWVPKLTYSLGIALTKYTAKPFTFSDHQGKIMQKNGIDSLIELSFSANIEAKIRQSPYTQKGYQTYDKDILLETTSIVEAKKQGWIYTSQASYLAYGWLNKEKTDLMPHAYFIDLEKFRRTIFYRELEQYPKKTTGSHDNYISWTTEFITPLITDFPSRTLIQFPILMPKPIQTKF